VGRREYYRQRRENETSEVRNQRLNTDRTRHTLKRANERSEERNQRLNSNREKQQAKRIRFEVSNTNNQEIYVEVDERNIDNPTGECTFCKTKYWTIELNSSKKYTNCCHDRKVSLAHEMDVHERLKSYWQK
jgi:hypothetical protein